MERRDALKVFVTCVLAQASAAEAASAPNAQPEPHLVRCVGRLMQAWVKTRMDLRPWVPPAFELRDPHRAFIKVYELKVGPLGHPYLPPPFSQYRQVCLSVLTAPPGLEPMHINLFVWEERGWLLQTTGARLVKKMLADIEMTALYPAEDLFPEDGDPPRYEVQMSSYGTPIMQFSGVLDGVKRIDPPPLNGFYFGGATKDDVTALRLRDTYLGKPRYGKGELTFWPTPNESPTAAKGDWSATAFGKVQVEGFAIQDVRFLRDYADIKPVRGK